jgi:acetolactate synthase I/II/III large subunit
MASLKESYMKMIKASDVVANFLADQGIRHVFGIIGSGNAHLFDSISKRGFTEIVCVHHEQAAVMAMQTYFRTTGKVSACILTTGAGSTNAVTGVVSAWMDSMPGLLISGNENSRFTQDSNPLRIWGIQGYDSSFMVSKVTKYSNRVMEPSQILFELQKAYSIASTGRPGPVWLDVPMNIQAAPVDVDSLPQWTPPPAPGSSPAAIADLHKAAARVAELLRGAQRPVLWLGHGIRLAGGVGLVKALVEQLKIPALVSWAGIDMIDSDHPLVFGRAGIYGQRAANFVLQNTDFLLTIGTRLAVPQVGYDLSEFARGAKDIAVVDIDPQEVTKHGSRVTLPIQADAKAFIEELQKTVTKSDPKGFDRPQWVERCGTFRRDYPFVGPEHADQGGFINSYPFMQKLERFFKPDQVVVTDMGTALLSGHQVLRMKSGQRLMTSTGLGEMGYGLPAAMGASFGTAKNGRNGEVICLNCDGGMMMNLQELQTIAHHQLPIKIIIFNNDGYLMIKHTQKALFKGHYAGTDKKSGVTCPDYTKLAKAFDFPAFQIRTWEDLDRVMPQVQEIQGPVICEVFMHPEQLFLPKLSLVPQKDGSIVSPPIEDLSPLLPREEMRRNMLIGLHPKSEAL